MDDVIKEGDGGCLCDFYKFVFLIYNVYVKINYVYVVFFYFVKIEVILFEEEVYSFMWNCIFNKYGLFGKNIFLDLRME